MGHTHFRHTKNVSSHTRGRHAQFSHTDNKSVNVLIPLVRSTPAVDEETCLNVLWSEQYEFIQLQKEYNFTSPRR